MAELDLFVSLSNLSIAKTPFPTSYQTPIKFSHKTNTNPLQIFTQNQHSVLTNSSRPWRIAISSSSLHSLWKSFFFESSDETTSSAAFGSEPSFFARFGDDVVSSVSVFGRLVVFDEAKSSMGLEAIGLTFGSGGDSESVFDSESDPDLENESRCFEIGVGSGFLGLGFLSVTGVDGTERGWERRHIQGRGD